MYYELKQWSGPSFIIESNEENLKINEAIEKLLINLDTDYDENDFKELNRVSKEEAEELIKCNWPFNIVVI